MRKFDHTGLLLAEYQGKLFEKSCDLNCSTGIFIRRFLHSDLLKKLDLNDTSKLSLDVNEGITNITEQFGDSEYGSVKYSKSSMFWIGYMYRYISYTREINTVLLSKLFNYKQLNDVYFSFHTQDPEWCVRNLLEINNISEDIFDNNCRFKNLIIQKNMY
ncbi:MAG: antitoxin [Lachnospiraceae bacterium]|nr:antitoxin [Lachnospiraceae bacterium]